MPKAIREDKTGRLREADLFRHFPNAMREIMRARAFAVRRHTVPEKGIDGRTNWKESKGTDEHDTWVDGCLDSAMTHIRERIDGMKEVRDQEEIHPLAFTVLNSLIAMEYDHD